MSNNVPLVFRAWKEVVFERRANRIHDMLSSQGDDSQYRVKEDNSKSNLDVKDKKNKTQSDFYDASKL